MIETIEQRNCRHDEHDQRKRRSPVNNVLKSDQLCWLIRKTGLDSHAVFLVGAVSIISFYFNRYFSIVSLGIGKQPHCFSFLGNYRERASFEQLNKPPEHERWKPPFFILFFNLTPDEYRRKRERNKRKQGIIIQAPSAIREAVITRLELELPVHFIFTYVDVDFNAFQNKY